MFIIGRILLGMGIPFAIVAASSLIGEISYAKERATLKSLFNASWFVGAIVAAGVTLGTFAMPTTWSWRIPSLLQLGLKIRAPLFIYGGGKRVSRWKRGEKRRRGRRGRRRSGSGDIMIKPR
ncbi:hypothetical protein BDZ91DRAFT_796114 [Kalaharituber pfeilii]|nr:hypothetical protein BDZ91DRAFT_796114 [Kalaharituber pfeilii]